MGVLASRSTVAGPILVLLNSLLHCFSFQTVCEGFLLGVVACRYSTNTVLIATGICAVSCNQGGRDGLGRTRENGIWLRSFDVRR